MTTTNNPTPQPAGRVTRYICQCGQLNSVDVERCPKCQLSLPKSALPLSAQTCEHVAQPAGEGGAPERRVAPYTPVPVPDDFPQRVYIRTQYASDVMGGVYHLERSERDMIEFVRATPPA